MLREIKITLGEVHSHEHSQEAIVSLRVVLGIENGEQNQAQRTSHGEEDRETSTELIEPTAVRYKLASVTKPALSQESQVEEDNGHNATRDEERFQARGTNIGDISVIV